MGRLPKINIHVDTNPKFIIINDLDQVYTGLIGGEANFSYDIEEAKLLQGQPKFDTLKRFTRIPLKQIFL
jgi:hypothetical protein